MINSSSLFINIINIWFDIEKEISHFSSISEGSKFVEETPAADPENCYIFLDKTAAGILITGYVT